MSEINSVQTHDGGTLTGNTASLEAMTEAFQKPPETDKEPIGSDPGTSNGSPASETHETAPGGGKPSRREAKSELTARVRELNELHQGEKKRADEIEANWKRDQAELEAFRKRMPTEKPAEVPKPAPAADDSDPEPKEDDFESYGAFVVATGRWAARQEHAALGKKTEAETRKTQFRDFQIGQVKKFNDRVSERAKTEPDLHLPQDVVGLLPSKPFDLDHQMTSDDLIGAWFTGEERGLDLMVYFKDHLDELSRIRTLSPVRVPIELARIEGRLNGAITASPAKPGVVRASPPVRPVTAAPPSVDDPNALPDATLSNREWAKKREALEERRQRAER